MKLSQKTVSNFQKTQRTNTPRQNNASFFFATSPPNTDLHPLTGTSDNPLPTNRKTPPLPPVNHD